MQDKIRNIAIIAHVDHGKTTLVDKLLLQSGTLSDRKEPQTRVMDSNELEQERGITILAKNTSLMWDDYRINIVDTPGHADFGGEVERVLSMVDSVLLLVDAVDGPMPQTRFVTQKAFNMGFKPIVVINKVDRDGARVDWVLEQTFDLFDDLDGTDEQLDFPVIYASAINGTASLDESVQDSDMHCIFDAIIENVPAPDVSDKGTFQMQISSLDYDNYLGLIGIGRINRGSISTNTKVKIIDKKDSIRDGRLLKILGFSGLIRTEIPQAHAGNIVAITGIDNLDISDTICDIENVEKMPALSVDEPTISMSFQANTSVFSGQDGKYVTSRNIWDRLQHELKHNVALRVEQTEDKEIYLVSGRGELHLGILIENMRREGYELAVGRPKVVTKEIDGITKEPYEILTADVEQRHQGAVMEALGNRKAKLQDMQQESNGRVKLDFIVPTRGLIGFRTEFLNMTSGSGLIYSIFDHYGELVKEKIGQRNNGVLIAMAPGKALGYALFNLQERGKLFIGHGEAVYEGMIIGIHSRENDLVVNPLKAKQLTNIRAAGTDENIVLTKPIQMTLEQAIEFINDDELVEVTPKNLRIRKKFLKENERKRASRTTK
ncbi:MAG: translational GTPase TypA [Gammaproteobacteria bacterium]|nr:MAG: translational GTPase TypA [Gammaproteobacteria bacterium]